MQGAIHQFMKVKGISRLSTAVEDAMAKRKDAAILRLARIQNGAEKTHRNGGRCAGK